MKFGVIEAGLQRALATQARLSRVSRKSWQSRPSLQDEAEDEGPTPWEERIARAKRRTASRRTSEDATTITQAVTPAVTPAEAAYLRWLEERAARIEAIRARLETGTYRVDSTELANDIVRLASQDSDDPQ